MYINRFFIIVFCFFNFSSLSVAGISHETLGNFFNTVTHSIRLSESAFSDYSLDCKALVFSGCFLIAGLGLGYHSGLAIIKNNDRYKKKFDEKVKILNKENITVTEERWGNSVHIVLHHPPIISTSVKELMNRITPKLISIRNKQYNGKGLFSFKQLLMGGESAAALVCLMISKSYLIQGLYSK